MYKVNGEKVCPKSVSKECVQEVGPQTTTPISELPSSVKVLLGHWDQLEVREGIRYRKWKSEDGKRANWRIVLPADMRNDLGMNKTFSKVRLRFYWVGMRVDIRSFIRQCPVCNVAVTNLEGERDTRSTPTAEVWRSDGKNRERYNGTTPHQRQWQ